jgi:2-aminoadipate transaminase
VLPPASVIRLAGEQRELLYKAPYAGMIPSARKAAIMGDHGQQASQRQPGGQSPETPHGSRIDPYIGQYAERARGMVASEIRALFAVTARPEIVSLAGGSPYVTALPLDAVGEMFGQLVAGRGSAALQYCTAQGDAGLREKICEVMSLEGIRAHPDDVVVTVGSQQALDLITRIFIDPGDVVLAEAPSYVGALGAFAAYQADVVHVPMDDQGLIPEALREAIAAAGAAGRRVKFLYTVPNFQNPAGVTLAAGRRHEILDICRAAGLLVIEDNPYGLLGFEGEPMRALRADDPQGVVYLGSFSKTFAPGLRVGWAAAPPAVRDKLVLAAESAVLCHSSLAQMAVREYLGTQGWREQIKDFRELYRRRRDAALEALSAQMPDGCEWTRPAGGFYVWLKLPDGINAKAMLPRAVSSRVAYVPGTGFYADGSGAGHIRLSYCFPEPERIREGVRRLASVIETEMELRDTFGTDAIPRGTGVDTPGPGDL